MVSHTPSYGVVGGFLYSGGKVGDPPFANRCQAPPPSPPRTKLPFCHWNFHFSYANVQAAIVDIVDVIC